MRIKIIVLLCVSFFTFAVASEETSAQKNPLLPASPGVRSHCIATLEQAAEKCFELMRHDASAEGMQLALDRELLEAYKKDDLFQVRLALFRGAAIPCLSCPCDIRLDLPWRLHNFLSGMFASMHPSPSVYNAPRQCLFRTWGEVGCRIGYPKYDSKKYEKELAQGVQNLTVLRSLYLFGNAKPLCQFIEEDLGKYVPWDIACIILDYENDLYMESANKHTHVTQES